MRFINSIIAGIVAVLVVLFAVSNRAGVVVEVWPFPYQLALPLYALILLAVLLGFIGGVIGGWMMGNGGRLGDKRVFSPRLLAYVSRNHTGEMPDHAINVGVAKRCRSRFTPIR